VTLTDEQRAGLARFLGVTGYKKLEGGWEWFPDHSGSVTTYVEFTDDKRANLMLALLERATEIGYEPESDYDSHQRQWFERIRMWMQDHPMLFGEGKSADKAEAVILAVLQLPEAQPPNVHP
jgi:hypothetical protein